MSTLQKVIKYLAIAFAIFLTVSIVSGILEVIGLIGGWLDRDDAVSEHIETYTVSEECKVLQIEIGAADFTIRQGDSLLVESNLKNITVKSENGVLTIREKKRLGATYQNAMLTLWIPAGTVWKEAEIITGAGHLTADALAAESLKLTLGAGEVNIDSLMATVEADIQGGAGKITVSSGLLRDLDLEMGVGQLDLTAALLGNSDFDLGIGESKITLVGKRDDYSIYTEKGISSLTVDGETVSGSNRIGNGVNQIEINSGIGAVRLFFEGGF